MALNAELDRVELYLGEEYAEPVPDTYDLSSAVNAPVYLEEGRPNVELVPVGVEPDHSVIGPEFRDRAGEVVAALEAADPAEVQAQFETGGEFEVEIGTDGEAQKAVVGADAVEIVEEQRSASGEEVSVLELDGVTVLVYGG